MRLGVGLGLFSIQSAAVAAAPVVSSIVNARGNAVGSTSGDWPATITGSNFTGATGGTAGGASLTSFVVVNDTTITCVMPARTAGLKDVAITTPAGTGTLTNGVRYWDPLVLSSGKMFLRNDSRTLSGSDITQVADQTGNSRHVDASSNYPTVGTAYNGRPVASHTTSQKLSGTFTWSNIIAAGAHHVFGLVKPANVTGGGRFIEDTTQWCQMSVSGAVTSGKASTVFWGAPTNLVNSFGLSNGTWYLFESYLSSGTLHLLLNGAHDQSAAASNLGGSGTIDVGKSCAFDWAEIFASDTVLSGTDLQRMYDYIATHYAHTI